MDAQNADNQRTRTSGKGSTGKGYGKSQGDPLPNQEVQYSETATQGTFPVTKRHVVNCAGITGVIEHS